MPKPIHETKPAYAVAESILGGEYNAQDMDVIYRALRERHKLLRAQRTAQARVALYPGCRVRVTDNVKPKRIAGAEGVVLEMGRTRVVVRLDDHPGSFRCSPAILEPITES